MRILLYFASLLFLLGIYSCSPEDTSKPIAKSGVIKITENDLRNGMISLDGEWEIYFKKLYTPSDFKTKSLQKRYINYPGYWNNLQYNDTLAGPYGYATYRLEIHSSCDTIIVFKTAEILTAYKIWFNGVYIGENGKLGKVKEEASPSNYPFTFTANLKKGVNELILHISNHEHRFGGVFGHAKIGTHHAFEKEKVRNTAFAMFLFGALIIMAIYHFILFFLRRKERYTLIFGVYLILIAIREIVTGEELLIYAFPQLSWEFVYKIEYLTFYLGVPILVLFYYSFYKEYLNKYYAYTAMTIGTLFSLVVVFTDATIYTYTINVYQIFAILVMFYIVGLLVKLTIKRASGALALITGSVLFFIAVVNDILIVEQIIDSINMGVFGFFILTLSQSYILADRFSKSFAKNEELTETLDYQNKNLEKIVAKRTEEVINQKAEIEKQNKELEKLSIVASETDNLVIIAEPSGVIEWINQSFTRFTGYSAKEYLELFGKTIQESSSNDEIDFFVKECIRLKKSVSYTSKFKTKHGNILWMQTTLSPVLNEHKEVMKLVAIDSNITKLKEAEEEILQQKEEILTQNDELEEHRNQLSKTNDELSHKNKQITDSINYAQRIQSALLPSDNKLKQVFDDAFIFFKPKDIVSGDFYWISETESLTYIAAADCTGHGVPGAFMSMIGNTLLNEIISKGIEEPSEILDELNVAIIRTLNQGSDSSQDDGMDISLCAIDKENRKLKIACAVQTPFFIKDNEVIPVKGDFYSIGEPRILKKKLKFKQFESDYKSGDKLYLFSDGMPDQFGGTKNTKYSKKQLLEKILEVKNDSFERQKQEIEHSYINWIETGASHSETGKNPQIDDVIVMGVKF